MEHRKYSTGSVRPVVTESDKKQNTDAAQKRRRNGLVAKLRTGDRTDRVGSYNFVCRIGSVIERVIALSLLAKRVQCFFDQAASLLHLFLLLLFGLTERFRLGFE